MKIFKRSQDGNEASRVGSQDHVAGEGEHAASVPMQAMDRYSFWVLLGMLFLLPIMFIPSIAVPFQLTKTVLVFAGILIALLIALISRLKEGRLSIPTNGLMYAVWALPLVYFLSALFSSSPSLSFLGLGLEVDTFAYVLLMAVFVTLGVSVIRTKEQVLTSYMVLFASFIILWIFQGFRLIFGPDFLSFDVLTLTTSNVFGKWNDLSIFFGLATVMSLVVLASLRLNAMFKRILYVMLLVSLFFLAVVNFTLTWVVVGLFALGFLVHSVGIKVFAWKKAAPQELDGEGSGGKPKKTFSVAALIVVIISSIFVISNFFETDPVGSYLSNTFNISQIEARPSWESTITIGRDAYERNGAIFGSGPNTFVREWIASRPNELNTSIFWNADFVSGIGVIPTAFVSTGLLGGLLWLVVFGMFLYSGAKSLLTAQVNNRYTYFISLSSFLGGMYLWIMMIFYTPNVVLVTLAFFLMSVYLASLRHHTNNRIKERSFVFANNPKTGFVSVFALTFLLLVTLVSMYTTIRVYASSVQFQSGIIELNVVGNVDEAQNKMVRSANIREQDRQFRILADIGIARLQQLQTVTDISEEELQASFRQLLANAIADGQRATELDANNYQNWLALGRVYQSVVPLRIQGAYENALTSFERALELNPNAPGTYLTLARLETVNGDTLKARDHITSALQLKNNYTDAIFLLSQLEISEGNVDEAIASVEAAALLTGNNPVIHFQLGLLKYNQNDNEGAVQAFGTAIAISPDYANAKYFLGLTLDRIGERGAAITQFEQVRATNPDNQDVVQILENLRADRAPFQNEDPAPPAPVIEDELPEELPFDEEVDDSEIDEPSGE